MSARAQLPNTYTSPPGEWRYLVPETGVHFQGSNWSQLYDQLTAHYRASGYKLPDDIFQRVEDYICANVPDYCVGVGGIAVSPRSTSFPLAHTFSVVAQGTRTLASWLIGGRQYVPQSVANTRAQVCSTCAFNSVPEGCSGCNSSVLKEAVRLVVGNRTTPYDSSLKACRVCVCQLQAKVHLPLTTLLQHMPDSQQAQLPSHCWIVKERDSLPVTPTL
jgi:hypothetical protein